MAMMKGNSTSDELTYDEFIVQLDENLKRRKETNSEALGVED